MGVFSVFKCFFNAFCGLVAFFGALGRFHYFLTFSAFFGVFVVFLLMFSLGSYAKAEDFLHYPRLRVAIVATRSYLK